MTRRIMLTVLMAVVAQGLVAGGWQPTARAADNQTQVVFSINETVSGIGYWIWCQVPSSSNPSSVNSYGLDCSGSFYAYHCDLTKHVTGSITGNGNGSYTMAVRADDSSIIATLTNVSPLPPSRGPTNTVRTVVIAPNPAQCFPRNPSGVFTLGDNVVSVTGP